MRNITFGMPGLDVNAYAFNDQASGTNRVYIGGTHPKISDIGQKDWHPNFISDFTREKEPILIPSLASIEVAETFPGVQNRIGRLKSGLMTVAGLFIHEDGKLEFTDQANFTHQESVVRSGDFVKFGNFSFFYEREGQKGHLFPTDKTEEASVLPVNLLNQLTARELAKIDNLPIIPFGNRYLVSHGSLGSTLMHCHPRKDGLHVNAMSYTSNQL